MRNRDFPRPYPFSKPDQESPSLLTLLIVVNLAAFVLRTLFVVETGPAEQAPAGFLSMQELHMGHWWTVFTHLFVHHDFFHLASNMIVLWLVGRNVLRNLGPRHFGYIYFLGGLAGSALELFVWKNGQFVQLIGASGSVFAVLGAYAVLNPYYSVTEPLRRWVTFRLRARSIVLGMIGAEIILEIVSRFATELPGINYSHLCHIGGGIFGLIYASHAQPVLSPFRGVSPSASRFMEEFLPPEDYSPFVPAGSRRRRMAEEEELPDFAPPVPEPLTDREFMQQNVNPILEKVHSQGFESLTIAEKKILDEAAARLKK